jgi:hypothetical protein
MEDNVTGLSYTLIGNGKLDEGLGDCDAGLTCSKWIYLLFERPSRMNTSSGFYLAGHVRFWRGSSQRDSAL